MTLLQFGLDALVRGEVGSAELAEKVASLKLITNDIGTSLHRIVWEMRPTALDTLGLAIAQLISDWEPHCSLSFDLHLGIGERRLAADVESTLYRAIQEGITNVVRHAYATRVGVILEIRGNDIICIIEDDGRGVVKGQSDANDSSPRRLGILGMREQLALINGSVELESGSGMGTTVYVRAPLGEMGTDIQRSRVGLADVRNGHSRPELAGNRSIYMRGSHFPFRHFHCGSSASFCR